MEPIVELTAPQDAELRRRHETAPAAVWGDFERRAVVYRRGEAFPIWPAWLPPQGLNPQRQSCSRRFSSMRGGPGTWLGASLALLAACAGAPVTWESEPSLDYASLRDYEWGEVRGALSAAVAAEARRVVDGRLHAEGLTRSPDSQLLVCMRFEPGERSFVIATPWAPGALAGLISIGPTCFGRRGPCPGTALRVPTFDHQLESVEVLLVDRPTNRVLCRCKTTLVIRGYADSGRIAAVRDATEELMAVCPLRR
jgi:hypothetical protein